MTTTISGSNGIDKVAAGAVTRDKLPAGSILQIVSSTKSDTFVSTSNSFVDTGLSVSITPTSATSKILVVADLIVGKGGSANSGFQFVRNSTPIGLGNAAGSRTVATAALYAGNGDSTNHILSSSMSYLDSPATTSSTTYKVQSRSQSGGWGTYINQSGVDADNAEYYRPISTITVMEIAA